MIAALAVAGGVACAVLFGGMLTFTAFLAPLVFRKLPDETAAPFMRAIFPTYYAVTTVIAAIGALCLLPARQADAAILAAVAATLLLARYWMMPMAQRLYDAREAGVPGAREEFARVHQRGALLNLLQLVAGLVVLVRLLLPNAA